jgi:hypothetical protein
MKMGNTLNKLLFFLLSFVDRKTIFIFILMKMGYILNKLLIFLLSFVENNNNNNNNNKIMVMGDI